MMSLATILACVLVADFVTGLVHWWEDTYADPAWPWPWGLLVAQPNIAHHEHPTRFTMSDVWQRNYLTVVPAAITGAACGWFGWWPVALTLVLASLGNEVHAWSHQPHPHRLVRVIQDAGLVQSPRQHARHHKPPYDRYYCTLTNVVNALLEPLRFWRGLEWAVSSVTGIRPRRGSAERGGF